MGIWDEPAPVIESLWSRLILRAAALVDRLSKTGPEWEYQAALEYFGWLLVQADQFQDLLGAALRATATERGWLVLETRRNAISKPVLKSIVSQLPHHMSFATIPSTVSTERLALGFRVKVAIAPSRFCVFTNFTHDSITLGIEPFSTSRTIRRI